MIGKKSFTSSLNKRVLNKLTRTKMPMSMKGVKPAGVSTAPLAAPTMMGSSSADLPSLSLTGKHAKKFHGQRPGASVNAQIRGKLQSTGINFDGQPTASIGVSHVMPTKKKLPGPLVIPPFDDTQT